MAKSKTLLLRHLFKVGTTQLLMLITFVKRDTDTHLIFTVIWAFVRMFLRDKPLDQADKTSIFRAARVFSVM